MRCSGEDLFFSVDEAGNLQTMLSQYIPVESDNLTETDRNLLKILWAEARDLAMLKHLGSLPDQDSSAGIGAKAAYVAMAEVEFNERDRLPAVTENTTEISASNRDGALSNMFIWAAQHLQEGGAIVQEIREKVLSSDYEDCVMSQELGSTNKSMADTFVHSFIRAGKLACWWNLQLAAEKA